MIWVTNQPCRREKVYAMAIGMQYPDGSKGTGTVSAFMRRSGSDKRKGHRTSSAVFFPPVMTAR